MNKIIYLIFTAALLCGCATGYQSRSFTGGFSDMKLQDNIYRINFRGNGYTGRDRAADFCLLRSAQVTLLNGYKYFIVLDTNSGVQTAAFSSPVVAQTYSNGYSATTYVSGSQTYFIHKPSTMMTIECFKDKPSNVNGMIYDADQINTNIRAAYGIK